MTLVPAEKQRILMFSRNKFFNEGFHRITMDELAREMRVSKKTIYKHFPSKDQLVREISDDMIYNIHNDINDIVDGEGDTIYKFYMILNLYRTKIINVDDKWFRDLRLHAPHVWESMEKLRSEKIYNILTKLLKQAKKEKLVMDYPNAIILSVFIAAVREVINPEFIIRNKFSMKQAASYTFNLLLNAVLTPYGKEQYSKTQELINN